MAKHLAPNTILNNNYKITSEVYQGNMYNLYLCTSQRTNKQYMMKQLLLSNSNQIKKFELDHDPDASKIPSEFKEGEIQYIIYNPQFGKQTLHQWIIVQKQTKSSLDIKLVMQIAKQIIDCVLEFHKLSVVYGDLNSNEIYIDENGQKVGMYGYGRTLTVDSSYQNLRQIEDEIKSNCNQFRSPEVLSNQIDFKNFEQLQKIDLWSIGCIFFEMLFGVPPFSAKDTLENIKKVCSPKFDYIQALKNYNEKEMFKNYQLNSDIINLCSGLFVVDPKERPTLDNLKQAIEVISANIKNYESIQTQTVIGKKSTSDNVKQENLFAGNSHIANNQQNQEQSNLVNNNNKILLQQEVTQNSFQKLYEQNPKAGSRNPSILTNQSKNEIPETQLPNQVQNQQYQNNINIVQIDSVNLSSQTQVINQEKKENQNTRIFSKINNNQEEEKQQSSQDITNSNCQNCQQQNSQIAPIKFTQFQLNRDNDPIKQQNLEETSPKPYTVKYQTYKFVLNEFKALKEKFTPIEFYNPGFLLAKLVFIQTSEIISELNNPAKEILRGSCLNQQFKQFIEKVEQDQKEIRQYMENVYFSDQQKLNAAFQKDEEIVKNELNLKLSAIQDFVHPLRYGLQNFKKELFDKAQELYENKIKKEEGFQLYILYSKLVIIHKINNIFDITLAKFAFKDFFNQNPQLQELDIELFEKWMNSNQDKIQIKNINVQLYKLFETNNLCKSSEKK